MGMNPELPLAQPADAAFDEFWKIYPRKVAKGTARKAWERAIRKASRAVIINGATRYRAERAGQEERFTKHPATWLNGECWDDEPINPISPPTGPGGPSPTINDPISAAVGRVVARRLNAFDDQGPLRQFPDGLVHFRVPGTEQR